MSNITVPDWPNHGDAWQQWRTAAGSARMHHAWLLAGKRGLGKFDFALAAARELVGAGAGSTSPSGEHPDIIHLTYGPKNDKEARAQADGKEFERARSIRVDQIRAMQRRLITRPTLGDKRVIIINPADDMEVSAANALLKSLEEPPQGTYFLLVTHRPSRLLPTIRSRCRILRLPTLSPVQLEGMLEAADLGLSGDDRVAAIKAAEGSYGAAIRFAEQDLGRVAQVIDGLLTSGDGDLSGRSALSAVIGTRIERERLEAVFELAQAMVAERARHCEAPRQRLALVAAHGDLVKLAAQAPSYNFDPGLLSLEIGRLLMGAAPASEPSHV